MSLVKRTYVDQETVITAENLNAIQDAIIENEEAIGGKYNKPAGGIPASDTAAGVQTSLGKADSAYQKPSGGIPATDMASGVQTSLGKADSAYQKPSGGIPSTDLASTVQTSLGKADSSYQKPSGGIPATDMASGVQTSLGKADSSYQKPSGGIPATDMASGVQTSLGKADSALQSSDIDNTLTATGKAADAKKTGDEISDVKNTLTSLDGRVTNFEVSTADILVNSSIAVSGNTSWHSASGTLSGNYKKYFIRIVPRGCLSNSAIISKDDIVAMNPNRFQINSYWDAAALGYLNIYYENSTVKYDLEAKTQTIAFDYVIYGIK